MISLWKLIRHCFSLIAPDETSADIQQSSSGIWCLVGNIVNTHPFGEQGETRSGTKHFVPGAKVYCLPPQWGDGYEKAVVVGLSRKPRRLITVVISTALITNWRAQLVYKPAVVQKLAKGFDGRSRQWQTREEVEAAAESLRQRTLP